MELDPFRRPRWWRAYSFVLVTAALFAVSWVGQFLFQVAEARADAVEHGQRFEWGSFWAPFFAATFENWQSEFLQLCWQAAGLAAFYFWGSSQSREGNDRLEAKVDELLRRTGADPFP